MNIVFTAAPLAAPITGTSCAANLWVMTTPKREATASIILASQTPALPADTVETPCWPALAAAPLVSAAAACFSTSFNIARVA